MYLHVFECLYLYYIVKYLLFIEMSEILVEKRM